MNKSYAVVDNAPVIHHTEEPLLSDLVWLSDDADPVAALTTRIEAEYPAAVGEDRRDLTYELGRLAFRTPAALGGLAARMNMSCNTCHTGGARNENFFAVGLSSAPGTFDATNALFGKQTDNDVFDPVPIPSLLGAESPVP